MTLLYRMLCFVGVHAWDSYDGAWRGCTTCLKVQFRVFGEPTDAILWRDR